MAPARPLWKGYRQRDPAINRCRQVPDRAARRGHAAFAGWCSSAHGPGRCAQNCASRGGSPAPCVMIKGAGAHLVPPKGQALFLSRSALRLLSAGASGAGGRLHCRRHSPTSPGARQNDHCSRLSFDTRHPQDSQQCQRRRFPPIARRSRDYLLIAAMGSGRGPWLSKMSLHERDRDLLQSPRYDAPMVRQAAAGLSFVWCGALMSSR
jgi:hypothetical protein